MPSTNLPPALPPRPTQDMMFMAMAEVAAQRSACRRLTAVGVVIANVEGTQIVSMGYNGQPRRVPHELCDPTTEGQCGCVHAEANALLKAPYGPEPLTMYTTMSPCVACARLLLNSRVVRLVYRDQYRDMAGLTYLLKWSDIEVSHQPSAHSLVTWRPGHV